MLHELKQLFVEIETEDFKKDTVKDVQTKFDTSGYSKGYNRPLPIAKNEKVVSMMKVELG